MKDEVNQLKLKLEWGNVMIKKDLQSSFINSFCDENILQELNLILEQEKDPKRATFLKYLAPAVDSLKKL